MSGLREYLLQKREAVLALAERDRATEAGPQRLTARVSAEGRSGVRRIRVGDFQIIMDSPPELAGYSLGPQSQELQLGVLGSCLTHIFLIQAALRQVPLDSLEVEVSASRHPRAGAPGLEDVPIHPHDISYVVRVASPASRAEIDALHEAVEKSCPIFNLFTHAVRVDGTVLHEATAA
jgi:uncharacterized OsmC-like protein